MHAVVGHCFSFADIPGTLDKERLSSVAESGNVQIVYELTDAPPEAAAALFFADNYRSSLSANVENALLRLNVDVLDSTAHIVEGKLLKRARH